MFFYLVSRARAHEADSYHHLRVEIFEGESAAAAARSFMFTWQANGNGDHWYAGTVNFSSECVDRFLSAAALLRKVFPDGQRNIWDIGPAQVINRLEAAGKAERVIADARVSALVPFDDVAPVDYSAFRAVLEASWNRVTVVADCAESAQELIARHYALESHRTLVSWINEGERVEELDAAAPVLDSITDLVAL